MFAFSVVQTFLRNSFVILSSVLKTPSSFCDTMGCMLQNDVLTRLYLSVCFAAIERSLTFPYVL